MAQPRFLYVQGQLSGDQAIPPWPGHGEPLRGSPAADGAWFSWRMVGRNNHELARCVLVYPSVADCAEAAGQLRDRAERAELRIVALPGTGRWIWRLYWDGTYLAVAPRSYHRQRECQYNLDHFLSSVPVAQTDDPRVIDLAQRRRIEARDGHGTGPPDERPAEQVLQPTSIGGAQ